MRVWQKTLAMMVMMMGLSSCGSPQDHESELKIIGGEDVDASQNDARRWSTVALTSNLVTEENEPSMLSAGGSFCTGTIISRRVILTAAHCLQKFDPSSRERLEELTLPHQGDFLVYFGTKVSSGGQTIKARKVVPHPDWSPALTLDSEPSSAPHDIGIIILEEDIPRNYKPAPLAPGTSS